MGQVVKRKALKVVRGVFRPLVLSTDGLTSRSTADEWKSRRDGMPEAVFLRMRRMINV